MFTQLAVTIKVHLIQMNGQNVFKGCYEHLSITTLHYCFIFFFQKRKKKQKQIQLA